MSFLKLPALLVAALILTGNANPSMAQSAQPLRNQPVVAGETAPDFVLDTHTGGKFSLSAESKKQPVLLVFYRGHW